LPDPQRLVDPGGVVREVPAEQVAASIAAGWHAQTPEDTSRLSAGAAQEADYGGVGGAFKAGVYGAARGLTLGLSDVAAEAAGVPSERLRGLSAENPTASAAGELGGALLPAIATGGESIGAKILSKTPAAAVSAVGHGLAENIGARTALGRIATGTATGFVEGGLFGGGEYLSQVALGDKPLSAEGFVGAVGHDGLFAAPLGGGFTLAGEALQRAKSLFPRSTITPEAGKVAAAEAKTAITDSVTDGDQMVELAKQKLDLAAAHDGMAAAGNNITRTAFGAPDSQVAALRGAAAAEHGELVNAIKAYEQSKAELNSWLSSEAGLDLESSLNNLKAPDVQKGVRKGPYIERLEPLDRKADRLFDADLETSMRGVTPPEVSPTGERLLPPADEALDNLLSKPLSADVQRTPVPSGEFGAAGKGARKSQTELEQALRDSAGPEQPATAVLGGKPRRAFASPEDAAIAQQITPVLGLRDQAASSAAADITNPGRRPREAFNASDIADAAPPVTVDVAPQSLTGPIEVKRVGKSSAGTFEASMPDGSKVPVSRAEMDDWVESQLPPGFRAGELQTYRDFSIERDLPQVADDVKENAVYVAKPSDLAEHGIYGNEIHPEHAKSMAEARKGSVRLDPIQVDITPDGKWYIEDGNHRLNEAAKSNSDVAIRFRPKDPDKGWAPQEQARDISDRLRESIALAPKAEVKAPVPETTTTATAVKRKPAGLDAPVPAKATGLEALPDKEVIAAIKEQGIPSYDQLKALDSDPVTTVPASEIRDRGWYEMPGQGEDAVKAGKARQAIKEGQRDPVQLVVSPSGKLQVNDGRNRLMAAVEQDAKVKVRWSYGSEPGPNDVHKFGASESAAAASADDSSLEALLRGTKSKLDAGEKLRDISEPSRAKYAADKAELRAAQAEHFRGVANDKNFAASDMGAAEREARPTSARYQDMLDRKAARSARGEPAPAEVPTPKSEMADLLDKIKGMSVEGGGTKSAMSDEAYQAFLAERHGVPEGYEIRDIVDGKPELRVKGSGPTVVDKNISKAMEAASDDAAIERALRKHNGKNKNIGPDLAKAAQVIGDHEAASAKLADLLGEQAPPGARARAAAFHDATKTQVDKMGAQSAALADHLATKTVVDGNLRASMQKALEDAKVGAAAADGFAAPSAADRTVVDKTMGPAMRDVADNAKIDALTAPAATEAGHAPTSSAAGKSALDAGTALEVMHALGVGVPSLSSIPVIGPILSLFLKARAVMGILGRKGGSVGRTAESSIAAKAAQTRERIAVATRLLLEGGGKVAKAGAKAAPPLAAILATKLFPGDDAKSKDPQVLFKARMAELANAQQPGAVHDAITDRIHASDPQLVDAIVAQTQRGLDFLASKAPKQTMLPGMLPGDGVWHPSKAALETWARYVKAVNDPASVLEDLAHGNVTIEGAETLRTVYPALYAEAQQTLLSLAPQFQKTMPYPRRIAIAVMYKVPIDGSLTPQHMQFLHPPAQAGGAPAPAGPGPAPPPSAPAFTGPLQIGSQTSTALDRRAGM